MVACCRSTTEMPSDPSTQHSISSVDDPYQLVMTTIVTVTSTKVHLLVWDSNYSLHSSWKCYISHIHVMICHSRKFQCEWPVPNKYPISCGAPRSRQELIYLLHKFQQKLVPSKIMQPHQQTLVDGRTRSISRCLGPTSHTHQL